MLRRWFPRLLVLGAVLLSTSTPVFAGTTTGTFATSAILTSDCTFANTKSASFSIAKGGTVTTSSRLYGTLIVNCTQGTAFQISVNAGTTTGGTTTIRKMIDSNGDTLDYQVFQDDSFTKNYGVGTDAYSGVGTGVEIYPPFQAQIVAGQIVPAGVYTDTLTLTLSY